MVGDEITNTTGPTDRRERSAPLVRRLRQTRLLLRLAETMVAAAGEADVVAAVRTLSETVLGAGFSEVALSEPRGIRIAGIDDPARRVPAQWLAHDPGAELPGPHVLRTGRALLYPDETAVRADFPRLTDEVGLPARGARAYLPLVADGLPIGWLALGWTLPMDLDDDLRELLEVLGDTTSRALQRARLLDARSEVADTLQAAMLSTLPTVAGLELAARYRPASAGERVGGDWYDALASPGSTTLVIGDVAGHDAGAAAQMGHLRSVLRGFAVDRAEAPSALLGRLDRANLALGGDTVATALVARLELLGPLEGARVTWSSAGHYPPVLVHRDGRVRDLVGQPDLLLGVDGGAPRFDHVDLVPPGATLLLFTDGLVELRGHAMVERLDALRATASRVAAEPLDVLLDSVLAAMAHPRDPDDVAVLAARPVRG